MNNKMKKGKQETSKEKENFLDYSFIISLFKETEKHTERDLTSKLVMNLTSWSS